jgi:hypothetical protein
MLVLYSSSSLNNLKKKSSIKYSGQKYVYSLHSSLVSCDQLFAQLLPGAVQGIERAEHGKAKS